MRYLSPAYLPILVIGVYALKYAGLDADGVREGTREPSSGSWSSTSRSSSSSSRSSPAKARAARSRSSRPSPASSSPALRYFYIAVLARRASPRLLAYTVPVLILFPLAWEVIVDFRFATSCWEGYHF